ncbi:hypothetical protein T11_14229 [Trichinella zimbabwensis]|uniref:Uncharacterized protein n=1 Tax=Trichinella zimbabwensis TaxID=268475 RepID=A0A0V1HY08_9BILA|nr:hypothetical protein T11_14229 [Trichinella zimbabwensis]
MVHFKRKTKHARSPFHIIILSDEPISLPFGVEQRTSRVYWDISNENIRKKPISSTCGLDQALYT